MRQATSKDSSVGYRRPTTPVAFSVNPATICPVKRSGKIKLFVICALVAFVQGWIALKVYSIGFWVLVPAFIGAIPFLLLNGVHGDSEGAAGVVGGILFVVTNALVYYWIARLCAVIWRRMHNT